MAECRICEYNDRPAEKIAHEVLWSLSESEKFHKVLHAKPNGLKDRQGIDFTVMLSRKLYLPIQVKGYWILDEKTMESRLRQVRGEGLPIGKRRRIALDTADALRAYMTSKILAYHRLDLLINDQSVRDEFARKAGELKMEAALSSKSTDYETLLRIYREMQHFFNIFDKAIHHAERYPEVKLFFIINVNEGIDREKQIAQLEKEWLPLLRKAKPKTRS